MPSDLSMKISKKSHKISKTKKKAKCEEPSLNFSKTEAILQDTNGVEISVKQKKKKKTSKEAVPKAIQMIADEKDIPATRAAYPSVKSKKEKKAKRKESKNGHVDVQEPRAEDEHRIFVGRLDYKTKKKTLHNYFSRFGKVENVAMPMRSGKKGNLNKGMAFVAFANASAMQAAMAETHKIDNRDVVIKKDRRQSGTKNKNKSEKRKRATDDGTDAAAGPPVKQSKPSKEIFKHSLFVGGIAYKTTKDNIQLYFKKFGKVVDVNLPMVRDSGRNKGFCFVSYAKASSMEKVLAQEGHKINSKKLQIEKRKAIESDDAKPKKKGKSSDDTNKLFIANLNKTTKRKAIFDHFSKYGKITSMIFPFFNQKKRNKGFCFLLFEERTAMCAALDDEHEVEGSVLDVQPTVLKNANGEAAAYSSEDDDQDDDDDSDDEDEDQDDDDSDDEDEKQDDEDEEQDDDEDEEHDDEDEEQDDDDEDEQQDDDEDEEHDGDGEEQDDDDSDDE